MEKMNRFKSINSSELIGIQVWMRNATAVSAEASGATLSEVLQISFKKSAVPPKSVFLPKARRRLSRIHMEQPRPLFHHKSWYGRVFHNLCHQSSVSSAHDALVCCHTNYTVPQTIKRRLYEYFLTEHWVIYHVAQCIRSRLARRHSYIWYHTCKP